MQGWEQTILAGGGAKVLRQDCLKEEEVWLELSK